MGQITSNDEVVTKAVLAEFYQMILPYLNGGGAIYDSNERIVGTWFGETLYQKTLFIEKMPNAGVVTVNHGISNLKLIISFFGSCYSSSAWYTLPIAEDRTDKAGLKIWADKTTLSVAGRSADFSDRAGYVTIQYTKTT